MSQLNQQQLFSKAWGAKYGFQGIINSVNPDAQSFFDQLSPMPDDVIKGYYNNLFNSLQSGSNNFSKHDRLYIRGAEYQQNALVSLTNPTSTATSLIGSPSWTQYKGFTGSTNTGLNINYIPAADSVKYKQNSACIWAYSLTNLSKDNAAALAVSDTGFTNVIGLFPRQVDGNTDGLLNSATDTLIAVENSMGLISITYDGTTLSVYQNGVLKGSALVTSTGLSTHSIYELTWNLAGSLFGSWTGTIFATGIADGTVNQSELFTSISNFAASVGNINRVIFLGDSFPFGSGAVPRLSARYTTLLSNNKVWMEDNRGVPGQSVNQTTNIHFDINNVPTKTAVDKYLCFFWSMLNDASLSNGGTQSVTDTISAYQLIINAALSKGWSTSNLIMANDYFIVDTLDVPLVSYLLFRTACMNLANSNGILYIENYVYELNNGGTTLIVSAVPVVNNHPNNLGHTAIATNLEANTP